MHHRNPHHRTLAATLAITLAAIGMSVTTASTACAARPDAPAAPTLKVGDPAPQLVVKQFLKGDALPPDLAKDKVHVVEFWATWCGPCKAVIPHLTALQKRLPDVVFVGVAVWEEEPDAVAPFVKEQGDKMGYRVAMDQVPAGGKPTDGAMAAGWLKAAGRDGIPCSFIVRDGRIAWIGHPGRLEAALKEATDPKFDFAKAIEAAKKEAARAGRLEALAAKLRSARRPEDGLRLIDAAIAEDAGIEAEVGRLKFRFLTGLGRIKEAAAYGMRLVETVGADDAEGLNELAWDLVDPENATKEAELIKVALAAAMRADKLRDGKDFQIADTVAAAHYASGDLKSAVEAQARAVKLIPAEAGDELRKELEERLALYRKAASTN